MSETTMTFKTAEGESGPFPLSALEDATERMTRNRQLSFDVGGQKPSRMKIGVTGSISIDEQLLKGQRVAVHLLNLESGELIAESPGTVVAVAFIDKTDKEGFVTTTREHKVAVDG